MSQHPKNQQPTTNTQQQQSSGSSQPPGTKPTPQTGDKASEKNPQNSKPAKNEQATKKPEQYR